MRVDAPGQPHHPLLIGAADLRGQVSMGKDTGLQCLAGATHKGGCHRVRTEALTNL